MVLRVEKFGVPLFISVMQKRTQLPKFPRKAFETEFNDDVARTMMESLRTVATTMLQQQVDGDGDGDSNAGLEPTTDAEALRAFVAMLHNEEEKEEKVDDHGVAPAASPSFWAANIIEEIPDCLVEALDKDPLFGGSARFICKQILSSLQIDYLVLDGDKISEHELDSMIRLYPSLLGPNFFLIRKAAIAYFLIHKAAIEYRAKFNTISFVPLLAKLGMEFGNVEDRGGLLAKTHTGLTPLQWVARTSTSGVVNVLKKLRDTNLLFEEDIRQQGLLYFVLKESNTDVFYVERFRYLAEWDPLSLATTTNEGVSPLHHSVHFWAEPLAFQTTFELGIRYFPSRVGFLFHVNETLGTPFATACKKYGTEVVSKIVIDGLSTSHSFDANAVLESLVFLASSPDDESDGVEGVFFLLRKDPSLVARALIGEGQSPSKTMKPLPDPPRGDEIILGRTHEHRRELKKTTGKANQHRPGVAGRATSQYIQTV